MGLSAEQITDGRNVLFVLKKHKRGPRGGGGGGIRLVAEEVGGGGLVKEERVGVGGGPPINIYLMHWCSPAWPGVLPP